VLAAGSDLYQHEMPGGQYTNLFQQAKALGLASRWLEVCRVYADVNQLFGDIVKVTPSSKVVGDMALFMTANNYSEADIYEKGEQLSFPDSVIGLMKGDLGQTPGGFPEPLQKIILKNELAFTDRPNAHLNPIDFDEAWKQFRQKFGSSYKQTDLLSYLFYPKVFEEYHQHLKQFGEVYYLPTPVFFFGLRVNEEALVELAPGKSILVKFIYMSEPDEAGMRNVFFNLNGQTRSIEVRDKRFKVTKKANRKVSSANEIGSPLQGKLSRILVKKNTKVPPGRRTPKTGL